MQTHQYTPLVEENHISRPHKRFLLLLLGAVVVISFFFVYVQYDIKQSEEQIHLSPPPIFNDFYNCFYPKLQGLKGNYQEFWHSFVNLTKECDLLESYEIPVIRPLINQDETKYIAYPKRNENITMVTLGIGHDVDAEMKLKELYPNTTFFGVDPASEINKDLYESTLGGKYFQVAISGSGGVYNSLVYKETAYVNETGMHIGADYFFGDMLREPKIDVLWVDTEGHEYTLLEQLHRHGSIEKKGVTICQINVELHKGHLPNVKDENQKFHDFVWKVLEDGKYIILKPFSVPIYEFIRLFILNVGDKECSDVYL